MIERLIGDDFVSLSWMHPYLASPLEGDLFYADFFAAAFQRYHENKVPLRKEEAIPKTLHFIWIGKKPFPKKSIKNLRSWREYHPDWKMVFWTDNHKAPLQDMEVREIEIPKSLCLPFENASNPSERSDYLRFDILNKFGGIYIDHDVECLASFDRIVENSSLFCMQNTFRFTAPFTYRWGEKVVDSRFTLATAVIGSKRGHPAWKMVFDAVNANYQYYTDLWQDFETVRTMHRSFLALSLGTIEYLHFSKDPTVCILPKISLYPNHFKTPLFKNLCNRWALCQNRDDNTWISDEEAKKFKGNWKENHLST